MEDALEELCTELGRFLIAANSLEAALFELHVDVSGSTRQAALDQCTGLTMGPLVDLVVRTFRARVTDAPLLEALNRLVPSLRQAVEHRNELVHAHYFHEGNPNELTRGRRPRMPRAARATRPALELFERIDPMAVFRVTDELWRVTSDLVSLHFDTCTSLGIPYEWVEQGQS